ncbi:sucrose phosphorylase [Psychrosphaera ytuae]|uniref:Sucrose phosphorylase n=1 Tax=Psychrosphaera ytuae TaxID=2820710 RepID=A0A975DDS6_9GAMM|nr:sucrose phosphorylase [Psychrosphaera ytuae]QTH64839.1 sucrose phosphorylase [Psychrosphaera ytuae]
MKNNVQLITYVDRLSGAGVTKLAEVLNNQLGGLFSGVHLLPFYYPIDGSDAGFDPIDHTQVDTRLGSWHDIRALGSSHEIMADMIVNHMSAQSPEFLDVLDKGKDSEYWSLFLTEDKVFPDGASQQQLDMIYRPRPGRCFSTFELKSGEKQEFWTTFTDNQIDIDVYSEAGQNYLDRILTEFSENNVTMIRLDAAGYAIKKADTNCFMLDETFDFINEISEKAKSLGIETLVEIHSYYKTQIEIAERVGLVYDFALPPLVLHSLFSKDFTALNNWLAISPRNCITVLDTHDGIGIIDVGPMDGEPGLLTESEIDSLVETIHLKSEGESRLATGAAASNVDLYQVNCTYFNALGADELAYLTSRAIQFFVPGVPQVYYGGLFACENDVNLLQQTNVGRDINRPYLTSDKIDQLTDQPIFKALARLISIRNNNVCFNGDFEHSTGTNTLSLKWCREGEFIQLDVTLEHCDNEIEFSYGISATITEKTNTGVSKTSLLDLLNLSK